jgi:hypothetical protein
MSRSTAAGCVVALIVLAGFSLPAAFGASSATPARARSPGLVEAESDWVRAQRLHPRGGLRARNDRGHDRNNGRVVPRGPRSAAGALFRTGPRDQRLGAGPASNEYALVVNGDGAGSPNAVQSFLAWMSGRRLNVTWSDTPVGQRPTD